MDSDPRAATLSCKYYTVLWSQVLLTLNMLKCVIGQKMCVGSYHLEWCCAFLIPVTAICLNY